MWGGIPVCGAYPPMTPICCCCCSGGWFIIPIVPIGGGPPIGAIAGAPGMGAAGAGVLNKLMMSFFETSGFFFGSTTAGACANAPHESSFTPAAKFSLAGADTGAGDMLKSPHWSAAVCVVAAGAVPCAGADKKSVHPPAFVGAAGAGALAGSSMRNKSSNIPPFCAGAGGA